MSKWKLFIIYILSLFAVAMLAIFMCGCHRVEVSNTIDEPEGLGSVESSSLLAEEVVGLNKLTLKEDAGFKEKLEAAKAVNEDVVGWIQMQSLNIDYPVLYSEDNKKYLRRNLLGEDDLAGAIYLDANCTREAGTLNLYHGHNMKDGTMFANVPTLLGLDNLDDLENIKIYTEDGLGEYRIFSVFSVSSKEESVLLDKLSTLKEVRAAKRSYVERSLVPISQVPNSTEMVMLNTCWYGRDGNTHNLHCIVVAARV